MRAALVALSAATVRLYWARWKSVGLLGWRGSRTSSGGGGPVGALEARSSESWVAPSGMITRSLGWISFQFRPESGPSCGLAASSAASDVLCAEAIELRLSPGRTTYVWPYDGWRTITTTASPGVAFTRMTSWSWCSSAAIWSGLGSTRTTRASGGGGL